MTVADQIAEFLASKGVTHAFGIVGAGNLAIFDAIARAKKTQVICCHGEAAAVTAAGLYYRQCGRLSVALVTTGAGSSNAITGVLSAFMDSTPVLIISGNEPSKYLDKDTRVLGIQGYDSSKFALPIVKIAYRMEIGGSISPINDLEKAYIAALHPRMGPAWVDCPRTVQTESV